MACHAQHASESGTTILVAEDDAVVRTYVAIVLRKAGFEVVEAADGAQAMELFDETPDIRLVLTDVVMPKAGGDVLSSHVAARVPAIPVVFMTGYDYEFLVQEGRIVPESALMQKPMTRDTILRSVVSSLQHGGGNLGI